MADLALLDEFRHGANRFLNRRIRIDAVLVVEVNVLDAQPLQTSIAGLLDVVGLAADTADTGVRGIAVYPEFCGQHDLAALALDRASDEFFVLVRPVDIGGVQKSDAEFERTVNGCDRFSVVASGVKLRHAHAAEAEGRNFETGTSKIAGLHRCSFFAVRRGILKNDNSVSNRFSIMDASIVLLAEIKHREFCDASKSRSAVWQRSALRRFLRPKRRHPATRA